MPLPKFMVMKSNVSGKYLCYGKGTASTLSSLTFSRQMARPKFNVAPSRLESEEEETPLEFNLFKFEVEEAKNAPGLVHIRASYNHKYLVRKSEESKSIAAEAHEPEEDQSKWSCTLLKPVFLGEGEGEEEEGEGEGGSLFGNKHGIGMLPQQIQLMHVASHDYVYVNPKTESMELTGAATSLVAYDVQATAILPQYLAFKGDDGKFIGTSDGAGLWFHHSDIADQGVGMGRIYGNSAPSSIVLFPQNYNGYWRLNPNNDVYVNTHGYMYVNPIRVNNSVALYSPATNRFISRTSDNGVTANRNMTIVNEARLKVVEPILSRKIISITYDLNNARVYGTADVTKITDSRSNYTNHNLTGSLTREYNMSSTMTWNQSVTVSVGTSMSMSFGIPKVGVGGGVSLDFSVSETCEWGEEKIQSETITHIYDFDVPPMTKQTKSVVATRSYCDVPFICEVEDLMTNGRTRRYTKTDCWFTGANDYNAQQETRNEPLPA